MTKTKITITESEDGFEHGFEVEDFSGSGMYLEFAAGCIWRTTCYAKKQPFSPKEWQAAFKHQSQTFKQPGAVEVFYATAIHAGLLEFFDEGESLRPSSEMQKLCDRVKFQFKSRLRADA